MNNILAPETEEALGYLMVALMTPDDILQKSAIERDYPEALITAGAQFFDAAESWDGGESGEFELTLGWKTYSPMRKIEIKSRYKVVSGLPQLVPGKYNISIENPRFGYTERLDDYIAEELRKPIVPGKPTLRTLSEVYTAVQTLPDYYKGTLLSVLRIFSFFESGLKEKFES